MERRQPDHAGLAHLAPYVFSFLGSAASSVLYAASQRLQTEACGPCGQGEGRRGGEPDPTAMQRQRSVGAWVLTLCRRQFNYVAVGRALTQRLQTKCRAVCERPSSAFAEPTRSFGVATSC
jgi:hypothetical protein